MALTKVSGGILDPGIDVAGIVTATGFDGPFIGGSGKNIVAGIITCTELDLNGNGNISGNLVIEGNLTANGDFTTLNTTLREVEILRVDADTTAVAGIITQRGTGNIFSAYDTSTEVFKIADGGAVSVLATGDNKGLRIHTNSGVSATANVLRFNTGQINGFTFNTNSDGTSSNERLRIANDGNVGINSTIPTAKLDVNGHTELDNVNIAGVSTHNEGIFLPDNKVAKFGNTAASPDLEIFHSGSVSRIRNNALDFVISNTANRDIFTDSRNLTLRVAYNGSNSPENAIVATGNGSVDLYYDGIKRFSTSGIGATVLGELDVTGPADIEGNLTVGVGGTTITTVVGAAASVGIGDASPSYMLDVAGAINSQTDVKINGTSVTEQALNDAVAMAIALG